MKKFIVLLIFFASCKNKKAELVDLEKKYSDSLDYYRRMREASVLSYVAGTGSADEEFKRELPIMDKADRFKALVDSIQWELKKY